MIISYEEFTKKLNKVIKTGEDFYLNLLETVISQPSRYCGLFRLSNAKTKLIQNVTQSNEIKFGDFMEDIVTDYLAIVGYENKTKDLGIDDNGDRLDADQVFVKDGTVYLIEQKIRDDHDSTKKRGQFANFDKKVRQIKKKYPTMKVDASMWFIDDSLVKNKRYYEAEMENSHYDNTVLHLYYGGTLFEDLKHLEVWNELLEHLKTFRQNNSNEVIDIPDFGNSIEIYNALLKLNESDWKKLNSNSEKFVLLRQELFSSGKNLEKAKINRK